MDNRFVNGCRRHGIGSKIAFVLLFGVAAYAAPRGADETVRGTGKTGTEVTRLVTGDPAQINSVVAGVPPTAILEILPVPAKVGVQAYTINGSSISAASGGFRAWFEVKVSNWDPNLDGSPELKAGQVRIDASGYMSGKGDPLDRAVVPCPGSLAVANGICFAAFGEIWAKCNLDPYSLTFRTCFAGYNHGNPRSDSICAQSGGGCDSEDTATENVNYLWFWVNSARNGRAEDQGRGFKYYAGTLVLDIPPGARGTYCVPLITDETFIAGTSPPWMPIPTAQENGFCVVIATGQCCYGLGTPDEGCIDDVLRAECGDDEPGPFVFTPEGRCPPLGPDCSRHFGACCDTFDGTCQDSVLQNDCQKTNLEWSSQVACSDVACISSFGACCDTFHGSCQDSVREDLCVGAHRVWSRGTACVDAECTGDSGACCDQDPFGECTDGVILSVCNCATCAWHKHLTCEEIDCPHAAIPTVSEWGLVIMTILLLTGSKIIFVRSRIAGEEA